MRPRLFAASVVGVVLCAVLGVWAWRMTTGFTLEEFCRLNHCAYSFNPESFTVHSAAFRFRPSYHQAHPLRADVLLVTAFVLALAAVALHRPRQQTRTGAVQIPSGSEGSR
jgi:hypothetical protein